MKSVLKLSAFLCGLIVLSASASASADSDILAGAPPVPKGYADMAAMGAARDRGEIKGFGENVTVPDSVEVHKDLVYGKPSGPQREGATTLDLYAPKNLDRPAPAIVFIHGGGWSGGGKREYFVYAVDFAKMGYVTASITYRFTNEAPYPAQVQDSKCAIRWLRAHAAEYHVDPNRIAVMGGSAGGYLALMVAYTNDPALEGDGGYADQSSGVQAVVDGYGPTDFTVPFARQAPQVRGLLKKSYDEAPDLFKQASPVYLVAKEAPPTLIIHGTIDRTVPIAQSELLDAKLTELGVTHYFDRIEGWPHTADSFAGVYEHCRFVIDKFLKQSMK